MDFTELIDAAAAKPSATSRASGVSRSTIGRIQRGEVNPTLPVLRELALALGYDIRVEVSPASDPLAATAARQLLDPVLTDRAPEKQTEAWIRRYERWGVTKDPERLVEAAGRLSNPVARVGARFYRPVSASDRENLPLRAAGAASAAGGDWALSGAATLEVLTGVPKRGQIIVWTERPERAAEFLAESMIPTAEPHPLGVIVLASTGTELVDTLDEAPLRFVAPVQAVIDLHGIGMGAEARNVTRDWGAT